MPDVNFGSQKVIDVKPIKPGQKKKIIFYLKLSVAVLWLLVVLALADRFHYHYIYEVPVPAKVMVTKPSTESDNKDRIEIKPFLMDGDPLPPIQPPTDEEKSNYVARAPEEFIPQETKRILDGLLGRIERIEKSNNNLLAYFSVRDLKDSLDDPDSFKDQLIYMKQALNDDLNVRGKIDILEQATSNGLVTRAQLLESLKSLQKKMDNKSSQGFSGSIKSAFGNLVKITKTSGEVDAGDYNSILKRAEIALSQPKITNAQLQKVIEEMKKLGKDSDDFVRQASNLQRVLEVTDFLLIYTKSKN